MNRQAQAAVTLIAAAAVVAIAQKVMRQEALVLGLNSVELFLAGAVVTAALQHERVI
jgi:hypothetical protein